MHIAQILNRLLVLDYLVITWGMWLCLPSLQSNEIDGATLSRYNNMKELALLVVLYAVVGRADAYYYYGPYWGYPSYVGLGFGLLFFICGLML